MTSAGRQAQSPEGLFADRMRTESSRPLVTFYDDASGERAELSGRSLANWVAKTHFLLTDELGLSVGDRAFVRLPVHWLAAPILLGCWSAGLEVISEPAPAQAVFADAGSLATLTDIEADSVGTDEVFAVSMLSMARSDTPPKGAQDYAAAVRPQPDTWAAVLSPAGAQDVALDGLTRSQVVRQAEADAVKMGLQPGGRLLWSGPWSHSNDWISSLVAPLAVGASVVLVRHTDAAKLAGKATSERASVSR